jgi:protein subunit release factor B
MLARRLVGSLETLRGPRSIVTRVFSATTASAEKPLPPRRKIDENEITESFLKGTGPGGQKINKTSSAVQLKHLPTGLVVKVQGTRSREQNRKDARRLLAERLEEQEKGDESRTAIKVERKRVKKASADKKTRRKYKKLAEEKAAQDEGDDVTGSDANGVDGGSDTLSRVVVDEATSKEGNK